jgi:hypothetical protein
MAPSYKFAIVRLAPDDGRNERINVGIVVFNDGSLDVRAPAKLDKVKAISIAADTSALRDLIESLADVDAKFRDAGADSVEVRLKAIGSVGPLLLSDVGTFVAENATAYEDRIASIMRAMISAEPATKKVREKRSKLLKQVKVMFRQERVLAKRDEDLSSHRIVSGYELDEGLVADLVLKNGALHVVETVDASGDEDSLRKTISEVGIAALVLERARMRFGEKNIQARLVYSASPLLERVARPSLDTAANQGAELINWASADERNKFIHSMAMLATPVPSKRRNVRFAPRPSLDLPFETRQSLASKQPTSKLISDGQRLVRFFGSNHEMDAEISYKHGNTLVRTLRDIYGQEFAVGHPDTAKLSEVLSSLDERSLARLVRDHGNGILETSVQPKK